MEWLAIEARGGPVGCDRVERIARTKREAKNIPLFKNSPGKDPGPEQEKYILISRLKAQQTANQI